MLSPAVCVSTKWKTHHNGITGYSHPEDIFNLKIDSHFKSPLRQHWPTNMYMKELLIAKNFSVKKTRCYFIVTDAGRSTAFVLGKNAFCGAS